MRVDGIMRADGGMKTSGKRARHVELGQEARVLSSQIVGSKP